MRKIVVLLVASMLMMAGCSDDVNVPVKPPIPKGVVATLDIEAYKVTRIDTPAALRGKGAYEWRVEESGGNEVFRLSDTQMEQPLFVAEPGEYLLAVSASDLQKGLVTVRVKEPSTKPRAEINEVYDYLAAPGQHINIYPLVPEGVTKREVLEQIREDMQDMNALVSLGRFGGYLVFGFDHTVVNRRGYMDLRIEGNAFWYSGLTEADYPYQGSVEPGIVQVSYDANGNGLPDDEWYEIKGSGHDDVSKEPWYSLVKPFGNRLETIYDYEVTYYRPDPSDENKGVRWEDNRGNRGVYTSYAHYPNWVVEDKLTFKGTLLPEHGVNDNGFYRQFAYTYGYVDNRPAKDDTGHIDIDWAVDGNGMPANLPGVDFVRVYNGVQQEGGALGECSPDVSGAQDLHLLGEVHPTIAPLS